MRANCTVLVFAIPVYWQFPSCVMSLVSGHSGEYHYNFQKLAQAQNWSYNKCVFVWIKLPLRSRKVWSCQKKGKNLADSIYVFTELCNWCCEFGVFPGKGWPLYKNYINKQIEAKDMSTVANVSFQQNQSEQNRSALMGTVSGYQHWPLAKATRLHHFCQEAKLECPQHSTTVHNRHSQSASLARLDLEITFLHSIISL